RGALQIPARRVSLPKRRGGALWYGLDRHSPLKALRDMPVLPGAGTLRSKMQKLFSAWLDATRCLEPVAKGVQG
ncbi:MAG: hypothetical protein ABSE73_09365, partial [Planctomycetota bacterium]